MIAGDVVVASGTSCVGSVVGDGVAPSTAGLKVDVGLGDGTSVGTNVGIELIQKRIDFCYIFFNKAPH